MHVTVRLLPGLPRLRGFEAAKALRHAFVRGCNQGTFRICQFSLQGNHAHLICEAKDAAALARGMKGWKTHVTWKLNELWRKDKPRRKGTVWDDRYHSTIARTPRQVRNALCYVMNNARRHREELPAWSHGIDPFSSAWYFVGWRQHSWRSGLAPPEGDDPPVAEARTWLLTDGWRRYGLIGIAEVPASKRN